MSFRTQIGPLNAKAAARENGAQTLRDCAPIEGAGSFGVNKRILPTSERGPFPEWPEPTLDRHFEMPDNISNWRSVTN